VHAYYTTNKASNNILLAIGEYPKMPINDYKILRLANFTYVYTHTSELLKVSYCNKFESTID